MSRRHHHNAKLDGYNGPLYPLGLGFLFEDNKFDMRVADFLEMCASQKEYFGSQVVETSDGYRWFIGLKYRFHGGGESPRFMILALPFTTDFAQQGGTRSDRSPAVYTKGSVTIEEVSAILTSLAAWEPNVSVESVNKGVL